MQRTYPWEARKSVNNVRLFFSSRVYEKEKTQRNLTFSSVISHKVIKIWRYPLKMM